MANKFNANRYTSVESIPTGDATQVENITVIDENGKEVKKPRDSTDRQVLRGLRPAFFDPTDAQANMGLRLALCMYHLKEQSILKLLLLHTTRHLVVIGLLKMYLVELIQFICSNKILEILL